MSDGPENNPVAQLLDEYNNLYLFSVDLLAKQDREGILDAFHEYMGLLLRRLHPENSQAIYLVDERSMEFSPARMAGEGGLGIVFECEFAAQTEAGVIGWAVANRRGAPFTPARDSGFASGLVLPLYTPGMMLGFVLCLLKNEAGLLGGDVMQILNLVAIQTSLLMENQANIDKINDYNRSLQSKVEERTRELRDKNRLLTTLAEDLDRKRIEAEVANRTKSRFLSSMSHEIRTPLNAIIGMSDMLRDTELSNTQIHYVRTLGDCGAMLLSLINDILDISKIEAGELRIEAVPFDLESVVEKAFCIARHRNPTGKVELMCSMPPGLPRGFVGDPVRVEQILVNLLVNAVKFTDEGSVSLFVDVDPNGPEGRAMVGLRIKDTGIGIAQDKLNVIFESFVQADLSTTRKFGGSGLGLAICRHLVEAMGGKIDVSSELGKGTEFCVRLPFAADESAVEKPAVKSRAQGLRAAVLDFGTDSAAQIRGLCIGMGMEVALASSDRDEFLRALPEDGLDLMIVDVAICEGGELKAMSVMLKKKYPGLVLFALLRQSAPPVEMAGIFDDFLFRPVLARGFAAAISGIERGSAVVSPQPERAAAFEGMRVLVADDIEINRIVFDRQLSSLGCLVDFAFDGAQVLERVDAGDYDLLFMDFHMPVMDGLEATRRLRRNGFETPIVALTADSLKSDIDAGLTAGMNEVLVKPVAMEVLVSAISRWTGRKQPEILAEPEEEKPDEAPCAVDFAGIMDAVGGDGALAGEVCGIFADEIGRYIDSLRQGLDCGDLEAARLAAHAAKNMAGNVCAADMRSAAHEIEKACREGDPERAGIIFPALEARTGETIACLSAHSWTGV